MLHHARTAHVQCTPVELYSELDRTVLTCLHRPMMIAIASSLEKIKVRLASSTLPTLKADSIAADAVDMAIADWLYKKDTSTLEAEGKHGITPMLRLCVTDDSTLAEPLRMMADWLHEKNENLIRQTTSVAFKLGEGMPKSVISGAGYSPVHVAGASGNLTMIQWLNSKLGTSEGQLHIIASGS